jgi:hypothetical protein
MIDYDHHILRMWGNYKDTFGHEQTTNAEDKLAIIRHKP